MEFLHRLVSTFWVLGRVKKAPGTVGSLAACFFAPLILVNKVLGATIILFLFIIGIWSVSNYVEYYRVSNDPKEVIIDEVVGQLLTLFLTSVFLGQEVNFYLLLLCFFSFRFFDITKIWPIGFIDKNISGSLGVMLDDIVAAILACILVQALYLLFTL